jgi:multicomponent K+:H+ antiporter subunit G
MTAEIVVSACILVGAGFTFTGALGLLRLPDVFSRLHGPTKASTLGVGGLVLASVLYFALLQGEVALRDVLVALFLFLTAPVSAHLMARAALHLAVDSATGMPDEPATHLEAYREENGEGGRAGEGAAEVPDGS